MLDKEELYDVAVIGGGAAGQMAALRSVLNHLSTVFFQGNSDTNRKGRAQWVSAVENIPGFFDKKRPIKSTTKDVVGFIESRDDLKEYLTSIKETVTDIRKIEDGFEIKIGNQYYFAKYVVLCTGTMDIQPEIAGSIKPILPYANRGDVEYCIRCDGHKTFGKKTVVIGNKSAAAWVAVMLKERYALEEICILTNGNEIEFDSEVSKLIDLYKIDVFSSEIAEIVGDNRKSLSGFKLANGELIEAQKGFVALGSIVYNELAKQLGADLNHRDHIITNEKFETSVSGFYAAGDLVAGKKKQVYTAWDMAVDAVDDIDLKLRIQKRNLLIHGGLNG